MAIAIIVFLCSVQSMFVPFPKVLRILILHFFLLPLCTKKAVSALRMQECQSARQEKRGRILGYVNPSIFGIDFWQPFVTRVILHVLNTETFSTTGMHWY
uniref:Uncharacterized protein n=1 Tax=Sphaerodactylus townsendi TaxID=933632 RepID=A0ACB8FNF4_9SAUR